jgi:hypothetical protein
MWGVLHEDLLMTARYLPQQYRERTGCVSMLRFSIFITFLAATMYNKTKETHFSFSIAKMFTRTRQ